MKFLFSLIIVFGCACTCLGSTSLKELLNAVEVTRAWPSCHEVEDSLKHEDDIETLQTLNMIYAISLINEGTDESIKKALDLSRHVQSQSSIKWKRDYAMYLETIALGQLSRYSEQIIVSNRALHEIDFNSLFSDENEFVQVQKKVFGLSGPKVQDVIWYLRASAFIELGDVSSANNAVNNVKDIELVAVLRNSIKTRKIMKSEDKGESYVDKESVDFPLSKNIDHDEISYLSKYKLWIISVFVMFFIVFSGVYFWRKK